MTIIVSDTGFAADDWKFGFSNQAMSAANAQCVGLDLAADSDPETVANAAQDMDMIRIDFPSFADGRGFTLARLLRLAGYRGRLRAKGHVIADQYAMARRAGFDEVEINAELAKRQPSAQWLARANWRGHDYQARLRTSL